MKIQKNKPTKKIILTSAIAAVAIGLIAYYAIADNLRWWPFNQASSTIGGSPASDSHDEVESEQTIMRHSDNKQDFLDKEEEQSKQSDKLGTRSDAKETNPQGIQISASEKQGMLIVTTKLSSVPSGVCNLTVSRGKIVIKKVANVIYAPEYSSCAGFSINKNELGSGELNIHLKVEAPNGKIEKTINYVL